MAQDITLLGASYFAVPAVVLPKTGGGTAQFTDASVTTAVESDVTAGKIFIKADGSQGTGTASGSSYENISGGVLFQNGKASGTVGVGTAYLNSNDLVESSATGNIKAGNSDTRDCLNQNNKIVVRTTTTRVYTWKYNGNDVSVTSTGSGAAWVWTITLPANYNNAIPFVFT